MLPGVQVRRRVDGTVVAEVEERHRVDLEVEVERRALGVAGVAHEPDHLPGLDMRSVEGGSREGGEVRVVELVAGLVDDPEPVAADLVEADGEDDAVGARDERLAECPEDVVAVVVGDVGSLGAEGVDVRRRAVDREDIAAGGELRLHLERLRLRLAPGAWTEARRVARPTGLRSCRSQSVVVGVDVVGGGAVWTAALAVPIWISVPAASPPWSAVRRRLSSVTAVLYPLVPAGAVLSTVEAPMDSSPQSPTVTLPPLAGWPSTRRFTTVVPFVFPPAPEGPVPAETRAVTASAVISPLKSDNWVTSASAFADAFFVTAVVAVAVVEAALTTEPSAGKTNPDVVTGCAAGGDADVGVAVTGWFGTAIRIA